MNKEFKRGSTFKMKDRNGLYRVQHWGSSDFMDRFYITVWNVRSGTEQLWQTSIAKKSIQSGAVYDIKHASLWKLKVRIYATHWTASLLKWSLWAPIFVFGFLFKAGAYVCSRAFELTNRLFNWVEDTTDKIRRY